MRTFTVVSCLWRAVPTCPAVAALPLLACLAIPLAQASELYTATLAFEVDGLDLDSGAVVSEPGTATESSASDIRIAYNAQRTVAAVVMAAGAEGVELAFLADTGMNEVSLDTVPGLYFSPDGKDVPFTVFDTVVVKTDSGAYYALGNATEAVDGVSFDYQRIDY